MSKSIHDKLGRVRPPRVHITYKVHVGDADVLKELPFIVGVLGDFSAHPQKRVVEETADGEKKTRVEPVSLQPMKDRKFIEINRDTFNTVMKRLNPGLNFRVENTLANDGTELPVQLTFESIDDFEPTRVANQIEPLRKLLEQRTRLRDLAAKAGVSDKLETLLEDILKDQDKLKKLQAELPTPPAADK